MNESFFSEMKRYVRFEPADGLALQSLLTHATPHFGRITEQFYARLAEHEAARKVFSGPAQVARLKGTLCEWMRLLMSGPWDEAYYQLRARIGRMHVQIGLPQRYMFGAMNLIRLDLTALAQTAFQDDPSRREAAVRAVAKIFDLELAIMLETFADAFVGKLQELERAERQLLEERLALSEARYDEIVEKAQALIVTADADGHILLFNDCAEQLTGLSRDTVAGRTWSAVFAPEAAHNALAASHAAALAGHRVAPVETVFARPDGDRRVRWHFTNLPGAGRPILCAMGIDITEEHSLAVRTRRAERLASLGTMAAGLAHEIRNPLNAAHLQLALLQRRLRRTPAPDVEGALGAAELVRSEMERLAGLVHEFLLFARPQPIRISPTDLRTTAREIVGLVTPEAVAAGIQLTLEAEASAPAQVDDERIRQVLLNLLRNAIEAAGRGGTITVRVRQAGATTTLEVEDDGPGIPPDAPIFEPFFTTKDAGTGLGLAIVHRIVADHGGEVTVESRPGHTVFTVSLPS